MTVNRVVGLFFKTLVVASIVSLDVAVLGIIVADMVISWRH